EDRLEAVAGPGKGDLPDPKQAAKEKRKRKRQAAKAAAAATKAKAVVASVVNNNDATMADANKAMDKKAVVEDDSFTLVGPRRGRSGRKPSSPTRQKTS
ncbi:MAG: hypothetical protein ACK56I_27100, partial [bacterium]